MANLTITNNSNRSTWFWEPVFIALAVTFAGIATLLKGTILAFKSIADAITVAADGGNTGDGTVTAATTVSGPTIPTVGAHILEMIGLGTKNGTAVGAATADGGNTGNGTASAVVCGAIAKAGNYILTCIDATVSGSEIFSVIAPDGSRLEDLTVGVAYSNDHFGVTISDGAAQFIVGDFWTIAVTDTGGVFSLTDPNGKLLDNNIIMDAGALQATVIEVAGMTFTITAGATDFVVGDKFTLTVAAYGKVVPFEKAGAGGAQIPKYIITDALTSTGAGDVPCKLLVSGRVRKGDLVIDSDGDASNVDQTVVDQLRDFTIIPEATTQLGELDNQ